MTTSQTAPALELPLDDRVRLALQWIPAGSFRMGARGVQAAAEPIHRVRITRPFYLGTYPVTQAEWRAVVERFPDSGLDASPSDFKGDQLPVENVSWDDVTQWCEQIGRGGLLEGLRDASGRPVAVRSFGLPTEAQWEYACRAGTATEYYTGDGEAALQEAGWFDGNAEGQTHAIGQKAPNAFGLYDMHGNVWEWCRDAWDENAYKKRADGAEDPEVLIEDVGEHAPPRVMRGGSWFASARICRAAIRDWWGPGLRSGILGFRVCLVPGPAAGN